MGGEMARVCGQQDINLGDGYTIHTYDSLNDMASAINAAHAARVKGLVEALEAVWPFLEEDENLCITPGYAEAIQKVRKAREVYRNGK